MFFILLLFTNLPMFRTAGVNVKTKINSQKVANFDDSLVYQAKISDNTCNIFRKNNWWTGLIKQREKLSFNSRNFIP